MWLLSTMHLHHLSAETCTRLQKEALGSNSLLPGTRHPEPAVPQKQEQLPFPATAAFCSCDRLLCWSLKKTNEAAERSAGPSVPLLPTHLAFCPLFCWTSARNVLGRSRWLFRVQFLLWLTRDLSYGSLRILRATLAQMWGRCSTHFGQAHPHPKAQTCKT